MFRLCTALLGLVIATAMVTAMDNAAGDAEVVQLSDEKDGVQTAQMNKAPHKALAMGTMSAKQHQQKGTGMPPAASPNMHAAVKQLKKAPAPKPTKNKTKKQTKPTPTGAKKAPASGGMDAVKGNAKMDGQKGTNANKKGGTKGQTQKQTTPAPKSGAKAPAKGGMDAVKGNAKMDGQKAAGNAMVANPADISWVIL